MHPLFAEVTESLHPKFLRLISMVPITAAALPSDMPSSGVYLFSEGDRHLYVGRSDRLRKRGAGHSRNGSTHNQATFAFRLAREETKRLLPSYQTGEDSRLGLMGDPVFRDAFIAAKARIRSMSYRYVEEEDPVRQALLEIYCAVALQTRYNHFKNT